LHEKTRTPTFAVGKSGRQIRKVVSLVHIFVYCMVHIYVFSLVHIFFIHMFVYCMYVFSADLFCPYFDVFYIYACMHFLMIIFLQCTYVFSLVNLSLVHMFVYFIVCMYVFSANCIPVPRPSHKRARAPPFAVGEGGRRVRKVVSLIHKVGAIAECYFRRHEQFVQGTLRGALKSASVVAPRLRDVTYITGYHVCQGTPQISRTPYISRDATYLKKYRGPPHMPRNTRYVKQDAG